MSQIVVTKIPKKVPVLIDEETGLKKKKRVCAYARVSTDLEDQRNSYEAQLSEYDRRIKNNPEWEFVGLYSDEGISGTCLKRRDGFQRMIKDALDGKIDLILVKSISRFARNTVDCLKTVRELRAKNVEVKFDKENISTLDKDIEIMLTIYASFAQEESKSISENVKWGVRKRMEKGQRVMQVKTTLGYDRTEDGKIVINESEAEIVREIFNKYLAGNSYRSIVDDLNIRNIPTKTNKNVWDIAMIMRLLSNEKYIGNFIMQKTVVTNFLDHKAFRNDGLTDKFVINDHHDPIVSQEVFEQVQLMKEKNNRFKPGIVSEPINKLAGVLYCACCGRPMQLRVTNYYGNAPKQMLTCKTVNKNSKDYIICSCPNTLAFEPSIEAAKDVVNKYFKIDESYIRNFKQAYMDAIKKTYMILKEKRTEASKIQDNLDALIKLASQSNDINKYKKEYEKEKSKLNLINKQIDIIKNDLDTHTGSDDDLKKLESFIADHVVTNYIVRRIIKLALRKADNSLRFVIGDNDIKANKEIIDRYLEMKPIFTSSINGLNYEIVKMEDSYGI